MPLSIEELLFLASSVIILPVIAVFTISFFSGGLKGTEDAKYVVLDGVEDDYWTLTGPKVDAGPASPAAADPAVSMRR
jgi:hypothetical protein